MLAQLPGRWHRPRHDIDMRAYDVLFYHGDSCTDGFTAAYIVRTVAPNGDRTYHPLVHGEACDKTVGGLLDHCRGKRVAFVDITPTPASAQMLVDVGCDVLVLDHHQHAPRDEVAAIPGCRVEFTLDMSGTTLACWACRVRPSRLARYVEDRDLGRPYQDDVESLPYSLEIAAYIRSLPQTWESWDDLDRAMRGRFDYVLDVGKALHRASLLNTKAMVDTAYTADVGGTEVPVCNGGQSDRSSVCDALLRKFPDAPFVGLWWRDANGENWSLRSRKDGADVGAVAKKLGGGGHAQSAGFVRRD